MDIVKPNAVWHVKKAIYGRVFGKEKGINKFETLSSSIRTRKLTWFKVIFILVHGLLQKVRLLNNLEYQPFHHSLRSDEWTAKHHHHKVLGYLGVFVDDLLIAGKRLFFDFWA